MIYLIGGSAKSGKTYIAKKILKQNGISYFSTDYLMVSLGKSNKNLDINIDADDFEVAKKLEPFLEPMIEGMIYNNIDYLIEGVHLLPKFVKQLLDKYPNKIQCCFVGYTEITVEEKVEQLNNHKLLMENCWYKHFTQQQMVELVMYMHKFSEIIKQNCELVALPYYEIKDIVSDSEKIISDLLS